MQIPAHLRIRDGIMIVAFTWTIACSIVSLYFMLYGFPDPSGSFVWYRVFIDGFFEAMSGFTTTGSSILPSVEVFPRSVLYFRSLMHWIGGMGIAFMSATIVREMIVQRETILNAESE
jgi:trk system potassium uptake protein